jgi:hypothetical protein
MILGLGCSFAWGESLYFYSDISNLPFSENHDFDVNSMTDGMIEFKNNHRYLKLVSDEIGIPYKYINDDTNGGSLIGTNHPLLYSFNKYKNTKLLIWQITDWTRDVSDNHELLKELNPKYLFKFIDGSLQKSIYFIKNIVDMFTENGTKVILFSWPRDIVEHELYNKFFIKTGIHMNIVCENQEFISFDDIIDNDLDKFKKYTVAYDFRHKGLQKNDTHFNLLGHQMIKDNIIRKIKEYEQT